MKPVVKLALLCSLFLPALLVVPSAAPYLGPQLQVEAQENAGHPGVDGLKQEIHVLKAHLMSLEENLSPTVQDQAQIEGLEARLGE